MLQVPMALQRVACDDVQLACRHQASALVEVGCHRPGSASRIKYFWYSYAIEKRSFSACNKFRFSDKNKLKFTKKSPY